MISINAGHGFNSTGCYGNGLHEEKYVRDILKRVKKILTNNDIDFKDSTIDYATSLKTLEYQCLITNINKCNLAISIHVNCATNSSANGIECHVYGKNSTKAINFSNKLLAKNDIFKNRGVKYSPSLYFLKHTNCNAVIIELGFASNKNDVTILNNNKQKIAEMIAQSIIEQK